MSGLKKQTAESGDDKAKCSDSFPKTLLLSPTIPWEWKFTHTQSVEVCVFSAAPQQLYFSDSMNRLWLSKVKIKDGVNSTSSPHFPLRLSWLTLLGEGKVSLHSNTSPCVALPSPPPPLHHQAVTLPLFHSKDRPSPALSVCPDRLSSCLSASLQEQRATLRDKLRQTHSLCCCCRCVCVFLVLPVRLTTYSKRSFSILLWCFAELQLYHPGKPEVSLQTSQYTSV